MIALILMEKIASLFLIMFLGFLLVRLKLVKADQSKVLSLLSIYLIGPCMILNAFQVDCTPDVEKGLLLALIAAIIIHIVLVSLAIPVGKVLKLSPVEKVSIIYSNAGNLIIPLITSVLGSEYVIYTCAFISIQLLLLWSHGKSVLSGESKPDFKKMISNINMISIFIGFILFFTRFRFPGPIADAVQSIGGMVGPMAMLVTGMLIGGMDLKKLLSYKRLLLVTPLRLIAVPLLILVILKFSGLANFVEDGATILMISLMATMTPSASTVTQMSLVYGGDAEYASAINVITTLGCIATMPLMIALYQM